MNNLRARALFKAMSLLNTFLSQTKLELIFVRRLMADVEAGTLAPSLGMTREHAMAMLAETAAERAAAIDRLAPLATPDSPETQN
ncbi:MAG: hypothetical protein K0M74_11455 [Sphingopyxis sp.]|nr:hypothetical protein [Sphingopyxis sp.]